MRTGAAPRPGTTSYYDAGELASLGLKRCGSDVQLSRHARIYSPETIEIGEHSRIDDFCILSGPLTIGNFVHIAAYVALFGRGGIILEDYVGISARTLVYSVSDDFSGGHLAGPTIPEAHRGVTSAPVIFRRFSIVGAGSVILPGVTLDEGAAIGAMSLVRTNAPAWKVSVGVPAKPIKDRARDMVGLAGEAGSKRQPSEGS
ncbi:MAG: acyltransferase [Candidatus Eiseniibacteriota bacterium]